MDKKIELIRQALIESISNYSTYKLNFQEIYLSMKENKKFENNILKYYNPEKDEKNLKFLFLLFFQHHRWINPNDIYISSFKEYFKIIQNDLDNKYEYSILKDFDNQKIMKIFVYWYIYILIRFSKIFEENNTNINNNTINFNLIQEIENILLQVDNKIINLYNLKKINTEEAFTFLFIYLFWIENCTKKILYEKILKIINKTLFTLLFGLFQKITNNILTDNENIHNKNNINIFLSFLEELKTNIFIHNDYNIIILLNNNIINSFMENILKNINPKIVEEICPNFSGKLADFYFIFLKFRFNKSKLMDFLINNTKNGLINLKYFEEEKEKVVNDVFIQNFQSELIQKIFTQENSKKPEHPNFNSFLFNGNNSIMSFNLGKFSLNDNMIIFSFHIKPNINNNLFNLKLPLICLYNNKNELIFKLFLKKIDDSNINNSKSNKLNNIYLKKNYYELSIIYNNKKEEIALNELNKIETNKTYFICIHLNKNNPFIHTYLYSSGVNAQILKSNGEIKMNTYEDEFIFNIGCDNSNKEKEYFSGYIGNLFIIKPFNIKNKIDYENNKIIIQNILQLKEYYRYFIYYLNINNISDINSKFKLDYISFYKNKNEICQAFKHLEVIKKNSKNLYEIILCLSPELFKFLKFNEKDIINNYKIPTLSGICENQKNFSFNEMNVTFVRYDYSIEAFLMKNGFNYLCLQFEYFYQFANYYMLFMSKYKQKELIGKEEKENEKEEIELKEIKENQINKEEEKKEGKKIIKDMKEEEKLNLKFYQENIDICIKLIKNSINNILLLLIKYILDFNIMNFSKVIKQIFSTLLEVMKSLNKISTIIDSTFHQLSNIAIIICEQLQKEYNYLKSNKNQIPFDENINIKFLTSFRDGLIDILLTSEYYEKVPTQFLQLLFDKIISIIESNNTKDITITYPKIFLRILSFTSLISESFLHFEYNNNDNNIKNSIGNNSILYIYLKLIKGLIMRNKKSSEEDNFFKQLFIFSIFNNRQNHHITYTFLSIINDLIKNGFSLEEKEINQLINYLNEIMNNNIEFNLDCSNDNNEKKIFLENAEKVKNDLFLLIVFMLLKHIFEKNNKKNFNYFCSIINNSDLNEKVFLSIINELINIISNNIEAKDMSVIKNIKVNNPKTKLKNRSNTNILIVEDFDFSNFYEDLFNFILILIKKKFIKNENNNNMIEKNQKENINKINQNDNNNLNKNKPDRVKFELINLIFFIEEMVSAHINNNNIQITTLLCLLNLIKLLHIITFDNNLIILFSENKFLQLFKVILESSNNSKIIYTNYYIETSLSIFKTIPESIMDICIKLINSDIIKTDKNKFDQEGIITKSNILDILKEIYLKEKKNVKIDKKGNRSLFCYNDIYRKLLSEKIKNVDNELNKINRNKILNKYFPKFDNEFKRLYNINNLLINKEKKFNYNFITFSLVKIFINNKYIDSSNPIKEDLQDFYGKLITKLIDEHKILYEYDKAFFFSKSNSNYDKYNITKNKIETILDKKKELFDVNKFLENHFSEKGLIIEMITSGLCENIRENKKSKNKNDLNKNYINKNFERKNSVNSTNEIPNNNLNISPVEKKEISCSVNINNREINNINYSRSRTNSFVSNSELTNSQNEDASSQSEDSYRFINNNFSPESANNNEIISKSVYNKDEIAPATRKKSNSFYSNASAAIPSKYNIDGSSINSSKNNTFSKKNLIEGIDLNFNSFFFNQFDSMYLIDIKKELIKNIFSFYFLDPIYYDKTFIKLKKIFIQNFEKNLERINQKNIYLNYPTKIKNFSNGIEPPLFVKPFNNFFEHKTTPISHKFFYDYIKQKKLKLKYNYINLFKKPIIIPKEEKTCQFKCELIKIENSIYGNIIFSNKYEYIFFEQEDFKDIYEKNENKVYFDGLFSLICIKFKEKENKNINKNYKSYKIQYKNKRIIILLSEIEEIVERRFLLMWQGFEIYLKDGRSYFFNLLNKDKYENFKKYLNDNIYLSQLIHKKDYLTKQKLITKAWQENILNTYEYLLFINKYASRSFNDPNQYYVFPWLLSEFKNLLFINNENLYKEQRRLSISSNNSKNSKNKDINDIKNEELIKSLRDLKYPISLQTEDNRKVALYRYMDEEEKNFQFHLGTHYSTAPFVYYYLMRQEPYNTLLIKLQNYQQENPNRMFIGILETIQILKGGNDNRELIPEFFSKIEFFLNLNLSFFGLRANNEIVNNVVISFIEKNKRPILVSDYVHLIFEHKKLLNSNLISSNIDDWINNIFGVGQLPSEKLRKNCCNIFRKTTYEKITNLVKKVQHYENLLNKKYNSNIIRFKMMNKINLIISFGQTPYQVFKELHPKKKIISSNKTFSGDDDILVQFSDNILRPSFYRTKTIFPCIYFEFNNNIDKIFGLTNNEEVIEFKFKINDEDNSDILSILNQNCFKIPHIKFFESFKIYKSFDYYVYKPKYAFTSFKNEEKYISLSRKSSQISGSSNSNNIRNSNLFFNSYYKELIEKMNFKKENDEKNYEESFKFIQCRYLDNSFKLYHITKIKNSKKKEKELIINSYSYLCEDFVSSVCSISYNQFLTGLENGKLIRWNIIEEQKNKIGIIFDKNIQAHKGRINAIEIDQRLGLIITCGNDNFVQIRKLYNFELITPIQINKKYIITMAKVSPTNFLYIMCFDKIKRNSIIFGYTLSGIKFAKSHSGYYCNIDFTRSGNIVSLLNFKNICILNGYNLLKKEIKKDESGYTDFDKAEKSVEGSVWMEFKYMFKKGYNNEENKISNFIIYIKQEKSEKKEKKDEKEEKEENYMIYYYDFKGNKIFE